MNADRPTTATDRRARVPRQRGARSVIDALVPIVGRDDELAALAALIQDPVRRLTTLVGPVGVGKSRLAATVANRLERRFPYGSHLVRLGDGPGPVDVVAALADAVAPGAGDRRPRTVADLVERLADRSALVVIDDCHDQQPEVAEIVIELLSGCPRLRLVVAGVEPLGIYGEQLFAVLPLRVPSGAEAQTVEQLAGVPAVALFLQRAAAVRPTFTLTASNAAVVAELCRELDGLPLALELAASRLKILQPEDLLAQVEQGLDALENTGVAASTTYTRMRDALSANWDLLPDDAQRLLAALGTFAGGFNLDAAHAVTNAPADVAHPDLELLIDRSFVLVDERSTGELRFSLLRSTRRYARERLATLDPRETVPRRHADYHLRRFVGPTTGEPPSREQWLTRLDAEYDDVTAALAQLIRDDRGGDACALSTALAPYWLATGRVADGLSWLDKVTQAGTGPAVALADALLATGELAAHTGAWVEAERHHRRALTLHESAANKAGVVAAGHQLGVTAYLSGDLLRAQPLLVQAVEGYQALGESFDAAVASLDLAAVFVALDDLPSASQCVSAVLDVLAATGDPYWLALARARLAEITVARGDLAAAEDHCRAAITAMSRLRGWGTVALALELLAAVLAEDRGLRYRRAVRLLGAAQAYRERYRQPGPVTRRALVQGLAYRLRDEVGDAVFVENLRAGTALSPSGALRELGAGSRPGQPAARLTQRQREVAELVASGLTNREIARRLGVAEWTVVNHVRQVLRKLEVSSRVHVARWFAEQQSA